MLCLYKSLIRPIIEYGNVIWGPHYVIDQQAIEKIQHRATKLIPELRHDLSRMFIQVILAIICVQTSKGRFSILISVNQRAF